MQSAQTPAIKKPGKSVKSQCAKPWEYEEIAKNKKLEISNLLNYFAPEKIRGAQD